MKVILKVLLCSVTSNSLGLPETWGTRSAGHMREDPCMQETCPQISTSLLSRAEYYQTRRCHTSKALKNETLSLQNKNERIHNTNVKKNIAAGSNYEYPSEASKRTVQRKTKNFKRKFKRQRHKRSQARTIISLNTNHTMEKVTMDPKRFWSNKKCHKYAMFKVKHVLNCIH